VPASVAECVDLALDGDQVRVEPQALRKSAGQSVATSRRTTVLAGRAGSGMAKTCRCGWSVGAIPSPTRGVPGTSRSGKGSLRSAYGRPLPGGENPGPGRA